MQIVVNGEWKKIERATAVPGATDMEFVPDRIPNPDEYKIGFDDKRYQHGKAVITKYADERNEQIHVRAKTEWQFDGKTVFPLHMVTFGRGGEEAYDHKFNMSRSFTAGAVAFSPQDIIAELKKAGILPLGS